MSELGLPPTTAGRFGELRGVIAMAVPVVITTSSRALMDVADYFMISLLDLPDAQAAILPGQMFIWIVIVLGMGTVSLVNTFSSQALGQNRPEECSAYAWQSVYIAFLAVGLGAAFAPLLPFLINAVGHSPSIRELELGYARVAIWTIGPSVAAAGLGAFFIGIHRPWVTTWSVIEANVVNVAVSSILIFGLLGVERMGIVGAAWGTFAGVVYRTLRLLLTLVAPSVDDAYGSRRTWRPSRTKLRRLLRFGLPAGLHWMSDVSVWALFVTVLVGTQFGTPHLVATNTAWQYMRLSFLPAMGVGQALTALVGRSIGAGDPERAMRETKVANRLTLAYMGALSIIYVVFRHRLMGVFTSDPIIIEIGGSVMTCAAVFQLFDALGITFDGALRGAGDTLVPAVFYVISTWCMLIGVAWLIAKNFPQLGSLGPWLAATTLIAVTAMFLAWRWHSRAWQKIDVLGNSVGAAVASPD